MFLEQWRKSLGMEKNVAGKFFAGLIISFAAFVLSAGPISFALLIFIDYILSPLTGLRGVEMALGGGYIPPYAYFLFAASELVVYLWIIRLMRGNPAIQLGAASWTVMSVIWGIAMYMLII